LDNLKIIPLFSTPVYVNQIEPVDEQTKTHLLNSNYVRIPTNNGWYTESHYILEDEKCAGLKQEILNHINNYVHNVIKVKLEMEFYITNSWVIKHTKNDWSHAHYHPNSLLSGCLYLQVEEDTGDLVFQKESNFMNLFPPVIDMEYTEWNIYNSKEWGLHPKNNMLTIFPSQLKHYVNSNMGDSVRYCLAFNVFVRGELGKTISRLNLK